MDCSLRDSSVCGILQVRMLEWVAISSSRVLPNSGIEPTSPVSLALQADALPLSHLGSLMCLYVYTYKYADRFCIKL